MTRKEFASRTSIILMKVTVVYQGATWWPAATEWQRKFFLQRCGFVVVTSVDIPMLQLLTVGLVMTWRGRALSSSPQQSPFSPEAGEARLES